MQGIIKDFRNYLPLSADCPVISLGEGRTPLIPMRRIAILRKQNIDLHVKFEGLNPTGSFKDRGMTVAVSQAAHQGARAVICASTGNTSAAAAAYAARAGIRAFVVIPQGKIALGKLAQAMICGAVVLQIAGNFDDAMTLVRKAAEEIPMAIVNSINPYRLQGQKTAAFEIVDALKEAPDFHCLPVGNAGNITAHGMGYREYLQHQKIRQLPRLLGYQASGAAPFIAGHAIDHPETVATAIRIGHPQSWDQALQTVHEFDGEFQSLDDEALLQAQKLLAEEEGVFCEPASAIALAGALKAITDGFIPPHSKVVCTLTGHGLKDPDIAIGQCAQSDNILTLDANFTTVCEAIASRI